MSSTRILAKYRLVYSVYRLLWSKTQQQLCVTSQRCLATDSNDKPPRLNLAKPGRGQQPDTDSSSSSSSSSDSSGSDSDKDDNARVEPELVMAARKVAASMGGNMRKTESALLGRLKGHAQTTADIKKGVLKDRSKLSDLFSGMKLEKEAFRPRRRIGGGHEQADGVQTGETSDASTDQDRRRPYGAARDAPRDARFDLRGKRAFKPRSGKAVSLFSGPRLNIFDSPGAVQVTALTTEMPDTSLWERLQAEETSKHQAPSNGFEEMIEWTKQGKLWSFPITNEQGEDRSVPFYDHIFLESHIDEFPDHEPIRAFMELVCTGLSKNPYLSVPDKLEHINWFREYFQTHEAVITQAMEEAEREQREAKQLSDGL